MLFHHKILPKLLIKIAIAILKELYITYMMIMEFYMKVKTTVTK